MSSNISHGTPASSEGLQFYAGPVRDMTFGWMVFAILCSIVTQASAALYRKSASRTDFGMKLTRALFTLNWAHGWIVVATHFLVDKFWPNVVFADKVGSVSQVLQVASYSTLLVVLVCQVLLIATVYKASGSKSVLIVNTLISLFNAGYSIWTISFGERISEYGDLGFYFRDVLQGATMVIICDNLLGISVALTEFKHPERISLTLFACGALVVANILRNIPRLITLVGVTEGGLIGSLAQVFAYEIGTLHSALFICLMYQFGGSPTPIEEAVESKN